MELNSILHQQHLKVSRYSGSFIWKYKISYVKHFHEFPTLLQVYYLQITQQSQPIYIPHNVFIHEHTLRL